MIFIGNDMCSFGNLLNSKGSIKSAFNRQGHDDNIYFIGDGAGKAGNIVTAAATGLVAARDILDKEGKNGK